MELYILIFLHNYFIMHDIKYFFLNKNNQAIHGEFFFSGKDRLPKALTKNTIFQNSEGQLPLDVYRSAPAYTSIVKLRLQ
jgi:hypothetical protein